VTIKGVAFATGSREAVGWFDETAVYIPKERIREAVGGALKESHIGAMLDRQGLLASRPEPDRFTVSWVPKVGRVKAYALRRSEFGHSGEINDPESRFNVYEAAADD
jgi:hypothetical protein